MKGTIKNLNEKGFGFISPEDGSKDLFFHATKCPNGDFKQMQRGETVEFEVGSADRGPVAIDVVVVK